MERPGEAWRGSWFVVRFVILDERPLAVMATLFTSMDPPGSISGGCGQLLTFYHDLCL